MKRKDVEKFYDGLDWAIRQMRSEGTLSMRQMILIFRVWTAVQAKGKRLTDKQIRKVLDKYKIEAEMSEGTHKLVADIEKSMFTPSQEVAKTMANFKPFVGLSHVVAAYNARKRK